MKRKALLIVLVSIAVVLAAVVGAAAQGPRLAATTSSGELAGVPASFPLGTAFTYQGQLKSSGASVNATCAFKFTLFDASTSGNEVGSVISRSIPVSNGLFTTVLDFGAGAFTGDARWLDMQLQCPTDGGYIPLTPRQSLTPAPMALALPGLWTQQNATSPNLIGGFDGNIISSSVSGATIGGGGVNGSINRILTGGDYATIGGGRGNTASGIGATVGGGGDDGVAHFGNNAQGNASTIGGGLRNTIQVTGNHATIAGGLLNTASNDAATVGGGGVNISSGFGATVPGGSRNTASGANSFAAGQHANTSFQDGAFVWGDSSVMTEISATAPNQFLIRAVGGMGINTNAPIANSLTVNGRIIAGGIAAPGGGEPFFSEGNISGYGMDDRGPGTFPLWVMYPQGGELRFYNSSLGDRVKISSGGTLTATGGFSGQCLSAGTFSGSGSSSCNMDVAEAFATTDRTEPGDVVALVSQPDGGSSPAAGPTVQKAGRAAGTLVVGVVSSNPGLVFDNGQTHLAGDNSQLITADRTVVALVGRVPVKVSLENGPIAVGEPLSAASAAGSAMKATQAGQILGYALQSSDEVSDGKLLAWLQPGLYVPPAQVARMNAAASPSQPAAGSADTDNASLSAQVAQLQTRNTALEQQNAAMGTRLSALEQARPADSNIPATWLLVGGTIVLAAVALRRRL